MKKKFQMPSALMIVTIFLFIVGLLTWFVPTSVVVDGEIIFNAAFDGDGNVIENAGTSPVGLWDFFLAPILGLQEGVQVAAALIVSGGFVAVLTATGALDAGIGALLRKFSGNTLIAMLIIIFALGNRPTELGSFDYNIWQAIPYFIVLIAALLGVNVFFVLGGGTVLFLAVGLFTKSLTFTTALTAMGDGLSGMFETIIVTVLVASIGAIMKANGGFEAILSLIHKTAKGRKGGMFGIAALTGILDIATANNTVTIVLAGPIAKDISNEYGIEPKKTASILDTVSCVFQGIIPYGAQLLVAAGLAGISSVSMMPYLYYPYLLGIAVIGSILLDGRGKKKIKVPAETAAEAAAIAAEETAE